MKSQNAPVDAVSIRNHAANIIIDLRGTRSRSYLRGIVAAVRACFSSDDPHCPYPIPTANADAFWAGFSEGIEIVNRKVGPDPEPTTGINTKKKVITPEGDPKTNKAAERAEQRWEIEELEFAVDAYLTGLPIAAISENIKRSPNAVIWKLWSLAGANESLRRNILLNNDAKPFRGADLRIENVPFRWVLTHLRSATNNWVERHKDVTLDLLFDKSKDALKDWRPADARELAANIENSAARWLFTHPEAWASSPDPREE